MENDWASNLKLRMKLLKPLGNKGGFGVLNDMLSTSHDTNCDNIQA